MKSAYSFHGQTQRYHRRYARTDFRTEKSNRSLFSFATDFKYIKTEKRQQAKITDFV